MSGREHGHDGTLPHSAATPSAVAPAEGQGRSPLPDKNDLLPHEGNDSLEVAPGVERENLQGWIPELATEGDIRAVLEKAFDYRGDVTVTRKSGTQITGYLFDRRAGKTLSDSVIRLMLATSNDRPAIPYSDIAAIAFTGRDTAAGKSYEAWVTKYWEKRAKGEKNISIEPEALE
jgi:hypothetical protein